MAKQPTNPTAPAANTAAPRVPLRERLRGKVRMQTANADRFYVDPTTIPEGVSFEWKRHSVYGQQDPSYIASLRRNGWEPALAEDFPEQVLEGETGPIIKDGQIAMVRPMELTKQARDEAERSAKEQVRAREAQLGLAPAGTGPRERVGELDARPQISKEYVRPVAVEP